MKKFSKMFAIALILPVVLMVGLVFSACGGNPPPSEPTYLTNLSEMDFIDQVVTRENAGNLEMVGVIFNKNVADGDLKATYLGNPVTMERTVIDNYNGDGSDAKGYQFAYDLATPVETATYNQNPIEIKVKVNDKHYKFALTTDLVDKILGL